jgi:hypothetical protein
MYKGTDIVNVEPDDTCAWLVEDVCRCGLFVSNGMGISPVPWSEVESWARSCGVKDMWVKQAVRSLSECYVDQTHKAKDPACPAPITLDIETQRKTVASQLKRFIAGRK